MSLNLAGHGIDNTPDELRVGARDIIPLISQMFGNKALDNLRKPDDVRSAADRQQVIERSRKERQERQLAAVRLAAALRIQIAWRWHLKRKRRRVLLRQAWEVELKTDVTEGVAWVERVRRLCDLMRVSRQHGDDVRVLALLGRIERSLDQPGLGFYRTWLLHVVQKQDGPDVLLVLRDFVCIVLRLAAQLEWTGLPRDKWYDRDGWGSVWNCCV
jgi:hypothetical protein